MSCRRIGTLMKTRITASGLPPRGRVGGWRKKHGEGCTSFLEAKRSPRRLHERSSRGGKPGKVGCSKYSHVPQGGGEPRAGGGMKLGEGAVVSVRCPTRYIYGVSTGRGSELKDAR